MADPTDPVVVSLKMRANALTSWLPEHTPNRRARSMPGVEARLHRWENEADPHHRLPEDQRRVAAIALRRIFMIKMSAKAVEARRRRREASS